MFLQSADSDTITRIALPPACAMAQNLGTGESRAALQRRNHASRPFTKGIGMEQKHSGLGVAAFVTSLAMGIAIFVVLVVAGMMQVSTPGGLQDESTSAMVVGLFIILFLGLDVVAAGLGIAGLMQRDRRKVFAVLGVIFATTTILGTLFLIILGNMM